MLHMPSVAKNVVIQNLTLSVSTKLKYGTDMFFLFSRSRTLPSAYL